MRKLINDILTTALEGLITIFCLLVIVFGIALCALTLLTIIWALFGDHETLWVRLLVIFILCYVVGKLVSI
jgi:hypothetical protein